MNLLSKKITCPLWTVISIVAFISLAIGTGNITVSDSFITVMKLITVIVSVSMTIVFVAKALLNYKDSIIEFFIANTTKIIIVLIITLVATLLSGCLYQVSIGAMQETVLDNIIVIEFGTVLFIFIGVITNIVKLLNTKKAIKRKARMHKLASLIVKTNLNNITAKNTIKIKALVTDLYTLSIQDITTIANVDVSSLYNSDTFTSLLNENANVSVSKDLGFFQNSLDYLVTNHCITSMEAATAKVVTLYIDKDILALL